VDAPQPARDRWIYRRRGAGDGRKRQADLRTDRVSGPVPVAGSRNTYAGLVEVQRDRPSPGCRKLTILLAGTAALAAASLQDTGTRPELSTLLGRAGEYVRSYHEMLTTIVAEEQYVQRANRMNYEEETRTLKSEFALVRGEPGENLWLAIRDVIEVDGQRIADQSRLNALLTGSRGNLRAAARAIADEQAKYNVGDIYRTINVPTLPLEFLLPDRQSRFRFREAGITTVSGVATTAVAYTERSRPTIIRTPNGRDVVAKGTAWIDREGRVLKTELVTTAPGGVRAGITVTYGSEPRLNLLVPVTMHETYSTRVSQITAVATYRNFRRFETETRIVR
jgi:hypothetical protein